MTKGRGKDGSGCGLDAVPPAPLAAQSIQLAHPPPASVHGVLPMCLEEGDGAWLMAMTPDARARCCRALAVVERGGYYDEVLTFSGLTWEQVRAYSRNWPGFQRAWMRAVGTREWIRTMYQDDEAFRRAVDGSAIPVMKNGECIGSVWMKSDRLLERLLDRSDKRRAGSGGGELNPTGSEPGASADGEGRRPVLPDIPQPQSLDEWVAMYRKMRIEAAAEKKKRETTTAETPRAG